MTTIEFFHDAVCGWCYLLSPRLREVARRYQVTIVHRAFVLQRNEQEMIERFGSLEQAKREILEHWKHCRVFAEDPGRINIEGMRRADFHYPSGFYAALAAKAAETLQGQEGHWRYFDAVQHAHLKQSRNIADIAVLLDVAESTGFPRQAFADAMTSQAVVAAVDEDNARAKSVGVKSIPSLLIDGRQLVSQTLSTEQLEALCKQLALPTAESANRALSPSEQ